jgi:hypothetical protein
MFTTLIEADIQSDDPKRIIPTIRSTADDKILWYLFRIKLSSPIPDNIARNTVNKEMNLDVPLKLLNPGSQ